MILNNFLIFPACSLKCIVLGNLIMLIVVAYMRFNDISNKKCQATTTYAMKTDKYMNIIKYK